MKYIIEIICNGVLITSTKQSGDLVLSAPLIIFCKDIYVAADVLTTWELSDCVKAATRADKLNKGH